MPRDDLRSSRDCYLCGSTAHGPHVRVAISHGNTNLKLNRIVLATGEYTNIAMLTSEMKTSKVELL